MLLFVFGIILPFRTDFFAVKIYASNNQNVDYSFKNVASPDLEGKDYLYDGDYRLYNDRGITVDYNVYNGIYTINGTTTKHLQEILINIETDTEYTLSYYAVSGTLTGGMLVLLIKGPPEDIIRQNNENIDKQITFITTTQTNIEFYANVGRTFNDYQFKLQLEKGDTSTPYTVPLAPYLFNERELSFEEGYYDGYTGGFYDGSLAGYDDGLSDGYNDGYYAGLGDGTVIGTYKVDVWFDNSSSASAMLSFYDVEPSTDNFLNLSLLDNKNTLVGNKNLYFNFDYGVFHLTPFINEADYINSGYQYAPYQPIGSGNMLRIGNQSMEIIYKGDLVNSYTLSQLKNFFMGFNNLYIIQLVDNNDYYTIFNNGYDLGYDAGLDDGYDLGYDDGLDDGYDVGLVDGYDDGYGYGLSDGYYVGYDLGYDDGLGDGDDLGYDRGYQKAIDDGSAEFGLPTLLSSLFVGLGSLLSIQLLPNISIGMIIAVPVVFGIIAFILGKRGGGD
jgi:hypothetical protein